MMISFSQIIEKLKEVFAKMVGTKSVEDVLHVAPLLSSEMQNAIQEWEDIYKGKAWWLKEPTYEDPSRVASLGLAQMISSEKARTALLEFESEITTPMKEEDTQSRQRIYQVRVQKAKKMLLATSQSVLINSVSTTHHSFTHKLLLKSLFQKDQLKEQNILIRHIRISY